MAISVVVAVFVGCASQTPSAVAPPPPSMPAPAPSPPGAGEVASPAPVANAAAAAPRSACGGSPLTVHFYDVSQALSALVDLPDGRHILVDAGDLSNRAGCGEPCKTAHAHLLSDLARDLGGKPIDLLWVTHQHSDHLGGVADLVTKFPVRQYVDNGRDLDPAKKQDKEVLDTRAAVQKADASITVVEPGHTELPLADGGDVHLTAIAPSSWLPKCSSDRNECSIMLRIDYCSSSLLFTGDEELDEEPLIDPHGAVTLLQAGHHGSNTSSGAAFLASVKPKYVVISADHTTRLAVHTERIADLRGVSIGERSSRTRIVLRHCPSFGHDRNAAEVGVGSTQRSQRPLPPLGSREKLLRASNPGLETVLKALVSLSSLNVLRDGCANDV